MTSFVGLRGVWSRLMGGRIETSQVDHERKRRELLCGRASEDEDKKFEPDSTQSMLATAARRPPPVP